MISQFVSTKLFRRDAAIHCTSGQNAVLTQRVNCTKGRALPALAAITSATGPTSEEQLDNSIEKQMHQVQGQTDKAPLVKVIGIGNRGLCALGKLDIPGAEFWGLDTEIKGLESIDGLFTPIMIAEKASLPISNQDVEAIVGQGASDADGLGNIGAGDGGVAFVLAPAAAIPGGPETVLRIVSALRAAGHFTVAAVARPFAFEGAAKKEQADALVKTLKEQAHLVAVMEQEVLLQAFGGAQLTVAEATDIADTALEHTVRCVMQAVSAQEVLKCSKGALMWHGEDLKRFKRLISPPLQQLLTNPGTAVLGRGLASMPTTTADTMRGQALLHLSSDAVRAASESPFLEGALENASAVLCCLQMPPADPAGVRKATQAAAGALRSITGASCNDFLFCSEIRQPSACGHVDIEATLLVLRSSQTTNREPVTKRRSLFKTVLSTTDASPQPPKQTETSRKPPSSNWNMLSAMAGGAKKISDIQDKDVVEEKAIGEEIVQKGISKPPFTPPIIQRPDKKLSAPSLFQGTVVARANQADPPSQTPVAEKQVGIVDQAGAAQSRVVVGDVLDDSLTAQSLDLPPAAARWRVKQRPESYRQRRLIMWEIDEMEPWEHEVEDTGLKALFMGKKKRKEVDIKKRMSGILEQDREELWDIQAGEAQQKEEEQR